jgi:GR25 family glycosyltransferase involved in LPS biosynthesis
MKEESFKFFNENKYYEGSHLDINQHNYIFYLGFNTYRALKIAQYFNYDRIIIFEDDIKFLKDINYIIDAMNFVKTQDFDICMYQTTFMEEYHGIKSYLLDYVEDLGNDMLIKFNRPIGTYGGGFIILTRKGINKIVNYFEDNNLIVALDVLDTLIDKMKLEVLYALKPLCVQNIHFDVSKEELYERNANINIEEYEQN